MAYITAFIEMRMRIMFYMTEPSTERRHVRVRGELMTTTKKCEHPGCNCQVASGKTHCSHTCSEAKKIPEKGCECKHPECKETGLKM
jgi:hypothetical protein